MADLNKNGGSVHHNEATAELLRKGSTTTKPNFNITERTKSSRKWLGNKSSQGKAQAVVATLDAAFGKQGRR